MPALERRAQGSIGGVGDKISGSGDFHMLRLCLSMEPHPRPQEDPSFSLWFSLRWSRGKVASRDVHLVIQTIYRMCILRAET